MFPSLLVVSRRLNSTKRGIFVHCEDCFGHAANPYINPFCQFGCNRIINEILKTRKFVTKSKFTQPVTSKTKSITRNIVLNPYPPFLLLIFPGVAFLLMLVVVIVKFQLLKKPRHSRVSSVEPQIANQYIYWNMNNFSNVILTFETLKFGSITLLG